MSLIATQKAVVISMFAVLAGCQAVPISKTTTEKPTVSVIKHSLTAQMPTIDRQGHIAFVEEQGSGRDKVSSLYSISPDGSDRQLIDQIHGYIYAPTWSADGELLAYSKQAVRQHPKIYVYTHSTRTRRLIVDAEGSNLSASFSPDGEKLLYSSTVGGNADIYEMQLRNGNARQLTTLTSTEVQPSYAPDGNSFVYVSDKVRAGRPSVYRYVFATGRAERISDGGYAASPQLSLDGQRLAYLNGRQAAVMTLATGQIINLAETGLDEPARLSPSGQYAVYPTATSIVNGQRRGGLVIHSFDGNPNYTISSKNGGVMRSPVWSR
ncbi:Xaa-Pro aminopeptidase [Psychrobacter sp.]|uniref:Xaa-Pro aminopeptidase n=1 Tax=Psychrobacter sp. TaxID=56811 RepID=UPI003F956B4C